MRRKDLRWWLVGGAVLTTLVVDGALPPAVADAGKLRPVSEFAAIADEAERSAALFVEAGKVLQHPRCINCHPAGDMPLQGEELGAHEPPVKRGTAGFGAVGMRCNTCHLNVNYDPGRVPGAPMWHLAPASMGWEGLSLGELCEQLKDPQRTGGRDLEAVAEHMAEDELVAWGWRPGAGRQAAPGSQADFAELFRAWIDTGAVCPAP